MTTVTIRLAAPADIPFIMQTERGEGFGEFVGRWELAQHEAEFAKAGNAYLIGEKDGSPNGFAILRDLDDPFGNVLLKRIAVREPGAGFGKAFLWLVMANAFGREKTHRLWLDVFVHNDRARHVYRSLGFREDGVLREAYAWPDGRRASQMLMSILRPEWR
ncbi:GNAT family N-acetyltransferase [Microvirga terricola]|uniref:GNAT family N-acetyltransferase n=1 Tax=Microvirga terricola TaxID=2719797 RepID=A0ABX0V5U6_9HYPH|nr:GNAT family N-acetyltransferase [Microvirga terricola]NIX75103.1 GNAT family N-acetyltransferase [Microvirga terricola]